MYLYYYPTQIGIELRPFSSKYNLNDLPNIKKLPAPAKYILKRFGTKKYNDDEQQEFLKRVIILRIHLNRNLIILIKKLINMKNLNY